MTDITHPTTGYRLRLIDIERDAEHLAAMWNASDDQWPGTWTKGVPLTAQSVRDWFAKEHTREVWVWDTGDAIAGYCSLWDSPNEERVSYVPLLNVAPQFQKYGLGRRFLTNYIKRAVELGSVRLDLGTWSGNLKAVPLYKKCGFFWTPDTSVWMQNYLPAIVTLPATQQFFARHDWYTSFQRELTQQEDDERWNGMKVFTYRFAAAGETLTVWVDREARAITAIETDRFSVAAIAADITPPRGLPTTLRWELGNKTAAPMDVSLAANGSDDMKLSYRHALRLSPGETTALEASVAIAATADAKDGQAAPALKSLLVIDGQVVDLATGMRPRAAIEVQTFPKQITLTPGIAQQVEIHLRNRFRDPVDATVGLGPHNGLSTDWSRQQVVLPPDTWVGLPVQLRAEQQGIAALPVGVTIALDEQAVVVPVATQNLFALASGGLLAIDTGATIRVENDAVRIEIARKGAGITFADPTSGESIGNYDTSLAPPAWPSEYDGRTFDLSLERRDGTVVVHATCDSVANPGLRFSKHLTFGAGALVTVQCEVVNLSDSAQRVHLRQSIRADHEQTHLTLPLVNGLTRELWELFPNSQDDEARQASIYSARWAALETQHLTLGMVWPDDVVEVEWAWSGALVSQEYECPAQGRVTFPSLSLYTGTSDWRAVRRLWERLSGASASDETPRPPVAARLDPPLIAPIGDRAEATLMISHQRSRSLCGSATLELPEGWHADATTFHFNDVTWQRPSHEAIMIHSTGAVGAALGRIVVRSNELDATYPLPLVRLSDGREVRVSEQTAHDQQLWTIDNGVLQLDVTPSFGGTVSSLRVAGVEQLVSSFPQVATFGWMSPWYGGLMPTVTALGENIPGKLSSQTFHAEPLAWQDARGAQWTGVRQRATISAENLRGLTVEIDTLTLGGSPIVRHVLRIVNTTSATQRLSGAGWLAFVQPGGSRAQTTIVGADQQIKASDRISWLRLGHWAAAHNPLTEDVVMVVTPNPYARMSGWGSAGGHLAVLTEPTIAPHGTLEVMGYLVLAHTLVEAERYAVLQELS